MCKSDKLDLILERLQQMSVDITALTAAVTQDTSVEQSAITLLQALTAEITTISNNSGDAATQTALNALVTQVNTNVTNLGAAVAANTPATTTTSSAATPSVVKS
jgi:hypothetical protein